MTGERYEVVTWAYTDDSALKKCLKGEVSRITINDMHSDGQIVVTFHVKQSKMPGRSVDYYGVNINDERLAMRMARKLCRQMNYECGYVTRGETK